MYDILFYKKKVIKKLDNIHLIIKYLYLPPVFFTCLCSYIYIAVGKNNLQLFIVPGNECSLLNSHSYDMPITR